MIRDDDTGEDLVAEIDRLRDDRDLARWLHAEAAWQLQDDQVATYNLYVRVVAALGPRFSITAPWHGLADAVAQIVAERDQLQNERDTWESEYERVRDLKLTDLADALAERDALQARIDAALATGSEDEQDDLTRALTAAESGEAYGWPIVADVLRREILRVRAALTTDPSA